MQNISVNICKLASDIDLPVYQTPGSVGCDISAAEDCDIDPKCISLIPTGLIVQTPPGYMLMLASRSSLAKKKSLIFPHGIGIIVSRLLRR